MRRVTRCRACSTWSGGATGATAQPVDRRKPVDQRVELAPAPCLGVAGCGRFVGGEQPSVLHRLRGTRGERGLRRGRRSAVPSSRDPGIATSEAIRRRSSCSPVACSVTRETTVGRAKTQRLTLDPSVSQSHRSIGASSPGNACSKTPFCAPVLCVRKRTRFRQRPARHSSGSWLSSTRSGLRAWSRSSEAVPVASSHPPSPRVAASKLLTFQAAWQHTTVRVACRD